MIYDCFPFFNELELLELRLHELAGVVDRFVLVESTHTHSGQPKPLYYYRHQRRFSPWRSRIIHVIVEDIPSGAGPWALENHQRDCIARGLTCANADDLVLVSDVDEIPRASALHPCLRDAGVRVFQQRLSYYFMNLATDEPWPGTRMLRYGTFRRLGGAQAVRAAAGDPVPEGGWHFSYMGGVRRIREKLRAYAHQENNTGRFADPSHLGEALRGSRDLFGRGIQWRTVGVQDLPAYVSEHRLRFRDWLYDPALLGDQPAVQDRCAALLDLYHSVVHLPGDVVLLGSAEDEAAIALANACCPDTLWAADDEFDRRTAGPLDAGPRGSGGCSGSGDFVRRLRLLTAGNVQLVSLGPVQFLKGHPVPLRFALAGSAHCLAVSRATLLAARAALLPGGIICGFSYGPRVSAALDELLPGYQQSDALWWWQR